MSLRKKRNPLSAFNLSFLDIMFCGFGAVVLLVLIVNSQMVRSREEHHQDQRARVELLQSEVEAEKRLVAKLRNSLEETDREVTRMNGRSEVVLEKIRQTEQETATYRNLSLARRQDINKLQSDLKSMDKVQRRELASVKADRDSGKKALKFTGEGHRQYLTGLRLGGRHVLLLIDSSASMLDRTIVGIIRRRNLPKQERLRSRKWRQSVRTARWILANLPQATKVKALTFNTDVHPLGDSDKRWVPASSSEALNSIISDLQNTVPENGTNFFKAFSHAARLSPAPDNIILLTDGLPTIGVGGPSGSRVTSEQRVNFFLQATSRLPASAPVNTILFPLEGDPMAAAMFWRLAVSTRGSFLTPASDWP